MVCESQVAQMDPDWLTFLLCDFICGHIFSFMFIIVVVFLCLVSLEKSDLKKTTTCKV